MSNDDDFDAQNTLICEKYNTSLVTFIPGHVKTHGRTAHHMKNPIWEIKDTITGEVTRFIMYCEPNSFCELCPESYKKIVEYENIYETKITWYKMQNGYICCSLKLFIHQIIMNTWGNGKGTSIISVDHIDRNPLNNRYDNLRIATKEEQHKNSKGNADDGSKRERKHNAKDLPEGLTQKMMKKYVVYYHEWLDKEHTKNREFFKVEKHPKLDKPYITSKSGKVSLHHKLAFANKVVTDLENDIYPTSDEELRLPAYVTIQIYKTKQHLIYDRRMDNGLRIGLRMVLPDNYVIADELARFQIKLQDKYPELKTDISQPK